MATYCLHLRSLKVTHTEGNITDGSIKLVGLNCKKLVSLIVCDTDESIAIVATNCKELQHLDVSGTDGRITDTSIRLVAANCKEIQLLDILETGWAITPASLSRDYLDCGKWYLGVFLQFMLTCMLTHTWQEECTRC